MGIFAAHRGESCFLFLEEICASPHCFRHIMGDTALDIISQIRQKDGSYNTREQRVASYVLNNLEQVSDMSVASLAAACEVSEPTVIRFCRTLGCTGYRDFKIRLAQNVAVSLQYLVSGTDPERDQKKPDRPGFSNILRHRECCPVTARRRDDPNRCEPN